MASSGIRVHARATKNGACWLLAAGAALPMARAPAQTAPTLDWITYAQLTAERIDGSEGSLAFGADRIRTRVELTHRAMTGGIMVDVGAGDLGDQEPGALANVIGDLYLNYRIGDGHLLRFGQFKTPLGMDFNVSGGALELAKRGMEAGLALNRDLGIMLSGRRAWSGLGYDVGVFNPAGRSSATDHTDSQIGKDSAQVARLHYDTEWVHSEIAYGKSTHAGGPGTLDYRVTDAGLRFEPGNWVAQLEWTKGRDIRGVNGWNEEVYHVHGAYRLRPNLELVVRHYTGESVRAGRMTELDNTVIGATIWALRAERLTGRVQVNLVVAAGDGPAYTGVGGFREDGLLIQFQLYAEK